MGHAQRLRRWGQGGGQDLGAAVTADALGTTTAGAVAQLPAEPSWGVPLTPGDHGRPRETARFLCELAVLAALAFWGFTAGEGLLAWVLGIGAPVLAAGVWGAVVAPKARWPVPAPVRVAIELALFGVATAALAAAGQPVAAVVLGVAGVATSLLNEAQERQAGPGDLQRRRR